MYLQKVVIDLVGNDCFIWSTVDVRDMTHLFAEKTHWFGGIWLIYMQKRLIN